MLDKMPVFAMDGHKEFRTDQMMHEFQFFLAGMAGNMHSVCLFVHHFRTQHI